MITKYKYEYEKFENMQLILRKMHASLLVRFKSVMRQKVDR